jgi:hypothetical protein
MPLSKRYVAVGDSAEVGIGLRLGSRARKTTKIPRVSTSDPGKRDIALRLEADVVENFDSTTPLRIHPQRIHIPPDNREGEYVLLVENVTEEAVVPSIVSQQPGVLEIKLPEDGIEPGEKETIGIRVAHGFEQLTHKTSFTMVMSDENKTRYTIPVEIGTHGQVASRRKGPPTRPTVAGSSDKQEQVIRPTGSSKDKGGGK